MELWIRSQDKSMLVKINYLEIVHCHNGSVNCNDFTYDICDEHYRHIGQYKTKKRAFKVLNEITSIMKNGFIVKTKAIMNPKDVKKIKEDLINTYNKEFIMEPPLCELQPINPDVVYYQMPEE